MSRWLGVAVALVATITAGACAPPVRPESFVASRAVVHVQSSGREEVTGANVLVAIFAERESHAAYFLQEQEMTRFDAVQFISHGIAKRPGMSDPRSVRGRPSPLSRLLTTLTGSRNEQTMTQPYGVAVGPDQRVYVADTDGGIIHVYNLGKSGYSTIKVQAQSLIGIAFLNGRLVVTDSEGGRVICLDARGREAWSLGRQQGFERPTGLAAGDDRLYVVDTMRHKVVIVSASGQVIDTFGSRGSGDGQFNFPTNIARAADGRLFVTDAMNFRVQVFEATGQFVRGFGRLGDASGDFEKPKGIALDSAGHVYVVEGLHDVVQIFDEGGRLLLSFGGSGAGDGQLWLPSGIAIHQDKVYIADSSNRRVQMFEYLGEPR